MARYARLDLDLRGCDRPIGLCGRTGQSVRSRYSRNGVSCCVAVVVGSRETRRYRINHDLPGARATRGKSNQQVQTLMEKVAFLSVHFISKGMLRKPDLVLKYLVFQVHGSSGPEFH